MLCAISGEVPDEAVVSRKTGTVFEKRLILKYLEENGGREPGAATDEELDVEADLIPVKTARVVRPRPPSFTSLPSLLKVFQDEWDALVLESYNTKEQLVRTREELAAALYQHDAAVRVIARLTRERDEARDALSRVAVATGVGAGAAAGGEAEGGDTMMVDSEVLPEELANHVDEIQQKLTKGRKKRPTPAGWATPDHISTLQQTVYTDLPFSQATCMSLDLELGYAALGGYEGQAAVYAVEAGKVERSLEVGEPVSDAVWVPGSGKLVLATYKGSLVAFDKGAESKRSKEHADAVTALAIHPGGQMLASVGADKTVVFYAVDEEGFRRVMRVHTDASLTRCAFHPDGHLFAAGTQSGDIKVFETKTGAQAAVFHLGAPVQSLAFSENGFWFAAAGKGQATTTIFDLRKEGGAARAKELETGDAQSLAWDYSGQFLATAGATGVTVQQYAKGSKRWSEPLRNSMPAMAVSWGKEATTLVTLSKDGVVVRLGSKE